MAQKVLHKRSKNISAIPSLEFGEIAVNYSVQDPHLTIKDEQGNLITFSSDNEIANNLVNAIKNKSDVGHTHTKAQITDFEHTHGTVTLTGDVSGSANFTNTGTSITVTVKDDSHTHDGRYYTETEVDAKIDSINETIEDNELVTSTALNELNNRVSDVEVNRAPTVHTHTKSDITDFAHTHGKADITDFAHTHSKADITDFAHTHTITATANDDDVVVLTGANGSNAVTYTASHATQGPNTAGNTSTIDTTTAQSPAHGGQIELHIPKITVNKYGHVTSLSDQAVAVTLPSDNNTHHQAKNIVGASSSAKADAAATNGNVWLNLIENSTVRSNTNIKGAGATTVTSDSAGTITISSTDTKYESLKNPYSLTIQKNGSTIATYDGSIAKTANIIVPTKISEFTNDLKSLTVGSKTYNGSAAVTITASDLGLAAALKYCGVTTTALSDGATTNPITINNASHTATAGCVVFYGEKEFVFNGTAWELLGGDATYKVVQSAKSDPTADGSGTAFIASITQDTNGVITATKKNVTTASTSAYGITKLSSAINSTSEALAATPKAVKTAYDKAVTAQSTADGKWTYNEATIKDVKVNNAIYADSAGTAVDQTARTAAATAQSTADGKWTATNATTATAGIVKLVTGDMNGKSHANGQAPSLNHTHSSYVNQNAFSNVVVGTTTIAAETTTDTLTLVAGANVTLTPNATDDSITITATDTVYTHPTSAGNKHIPSGGSSGQFLGWSADGTAKWVNNPNTDSSCTQSGHYTPSATASTLGATSGNNYIRGINLDSKKHVISVSTGTPTDTNTTYSAGSGLALSNTTFSADGSAIINALGEGTSPAQRGDYIVAQYAGGGTTTTTYHRRSLANIFAALNKSDITTALGYTPPTTDTNTWRPVYNGVDSTDTSSAATANAVKTAYDKAVSAYNLANGKTSNVGTVTSVKVTGGTGLSGGGTVTSSGTITLNHAAAYTGTSLTKSTSGANYYLTAVTLSMDGLGHVTGLSGSESYDDDANTHYTTRLYAGASGTAAHSAVTNPYLKVTDDNTYRNQVRFVGGGATTITSDSAGTITITSTDTNTDSACTQDGHYTPSTSASTLGATSGNKYIRGIHLDSKKHVISVSTGTPTDTNTTYSVATNATAGLVKPLKHYSGSISTPSATSATTAPSVNAITTTSGRYYAVEMDAAGRMFVNVPWTDTDTNTNYYLTGVSGSGNGTVTFTRQGLGDLTWNAGHSHSEYSGTGHTHSYLPLSGGTLSGGVTSSANITMKTNGGGIILDQNNGTTSIMVRPSGTTSGGNSVLKLESTTLNLGSSNYNTTVKGTSITLSANTNVTGSLTVGGKAVLTDYTDTNYYLTGVSGSGNGTVTFTRQGLGNLTWDASHTHSGYLSTIENSTFGSIYYGSQVIRPTSTSTSNGCYLGNSSYKWNGVYTSYINGIAVPASPAFSDESCTLSGHYTPSSSTTITAKTSGADYYVTGVTLNVDSKGHVTAMSVSSSVDDKGSSTSGSYLPLAGGTLTGGVTGTTMKLTGDLRLSGSTNYGSGRSIYFGDGSNAYISEITDDEITIYGSERITLTTSYDQTLYLADEGAYFNCAVYSTSDERLKDFCDEIDVDFDKLKNIPKSYFTWKSDENKKLQIGTSAQKVKELYPELVSGNEDETLFVDYAKLSIVALKAIDVLHDENEKLKSIIEKMDERIAELEKKLGE